MHIAVQHAHRKETRHTKQRLVTCHPCRQIPSPSLPFPFSLSLCSIPYNSPSPPHPHLPNPFTINECHKYQPIATVIYSEHGSTQLVCDKNGLGQIKYGKHVVDLHQYNSTMKLCNNVSLVYPLFSHMLHCELVYSLLLRW